METKHTPGHWAVTKEDHRLKVHPVGWENTVVCEWKEGRTGAGRGGTRHYTGNYPPYAEGDARLIAAAPDLLAACRGAEEWLDHHGGDPDTDPGLAELLKMLRAAIAAAMGLED